MKTEQGFTLVEMLVALAVFVLIGGAAVNLVVSSIAGQRAAFADQTVVDQISSVVEYVSRAIRQANKDLTGLCIASGTNYGIPGGGQTGQALRFRDKEGFCREFSFNIATSAIQERKSRVANGAVAFDAFIPLTSNDITIRGVWFFIQGEDQMDNLQPRVTFFIDTQGLQFQTTVSQRKFDVQE